MLTPFLITIRVYTIWSVVVNPLNEIFLFTKWLGIRAAVGVVDPDQLVNKNCERARKKKKRFAPDMRGPPRKKSLSALLCGNLYSDVFPFCLVQPLTGFGSHLYTATLRPLRWWDFVSKTYPFCVELPLRFGLLPSPCICIIAPIYSVVNTFLNFFSEMSLPLIPDDLEGGLEVVVVDPLDKVAKALDLDSAGALALTKVGNHGH